MQGGIAIFQSYKRLKNVEKQKLHFYFSRSEKSRMDLFRAYLIYGSYPVTLSAEQGQYTFMPR